MGMFDFIIKPINKIIEAVRFIICLLAYIGKIFKWLGISIAIIIKVILSMPFCFFFYLLHAFWEFLLFMVFEVLIILALLPSRIIGKFLGYPIKIPDNDEIRKLKKNMGAQKIYGYVSPKLISRCYSFDSIPTFPEWNLKVPRF